MHHTRLLNSEWNQVEERFKKRLSCWKSKFLSVGGRLVLINSVLSSIPLFMFSMFEVPKGVLERLDGYRSRFYWKNEGLLVPCAKWGTLCTPKELGGLGILDLDIQNKCFLSKWLFRLLNSEGIWQSLLCRKYLNNKTLSQVQPVSGDSHFWTSILHVKDTFFRLGSFQLGYGSKVRF